MGREHHRRAAPAKEYRALGLQNAELRVEGEGAAGRIVGYAAVWDTETELFRGFHEVVRRGAFAKSLEEGDQKAFWNHNADKILGRRSTGQLKLEEDDRGLRYELDPIDTEDGRATLTRIRTGVVDGSSFAFRAVKDRVTTRTDETELRELLEVDLVEVSPVVFPQYPEAVAQVRSALFGPPALRSAAHFLSALRTGGLTDEEIRVACQGVIQELGAGGNDQRSAPPAQALEDVLREIDLVEHETEA